MTHYGHGIENDSHEDLVQELILMVPLQCSTYSLRAEPLEGFGCLLLPSSLPGCISICFTAIATC